MVRSRENHPTLDLISSTQGSTNSRSRNVRKSRGKFKSIGILKKKKARKNSKLPVQIDLESRRPFGENEKGLVGEIGRLVSLHAAFDVPTWRDVPLDRKVEIYDKIWDKYELKVGDEICNNDHVKAIIYELACRRYRDIRSKCYAHYQAYETDEDRIQNPFPSIDPSEWAWLVQYFGSEKFQAMSKRNKTNRSKQVVSHITGRRSFKQTSWIERNNEGEEPSAHELWRITHQKKDGSWGSERSRQVYESVKKRLEELSSQLCDSPTPINPQEVLTSVVGERSGYIRGRGCGPRPALKSAIVKATIAKLQAQIKDKDSQMSQMMSEFEERLQKQKEEVTAEVAARHGSIVNRMFMDMMSNIQNKTLQSRDELTGQEH